MSFSVSVGLLVTSYKRLQKKLHPDKFAQASKVPRTDSDSAPALASMYTYTRAAAAPLSDLCQPQLTNPAGAGVFVCGCVDGRVWLAAAECAGCVVVAEQPSEPRVQHSQRPAQQSPLPRQRHRPNTSLPRRNRSSATASLAASRSCPACCVCGAAVWFWQLSVLGVEYGEGSSEADSALLLEVLSLREQLEALRQQTAEADSSTSTAQSLEVQSSLSELHSVIASRIADIERRLAIAFDSSDYDAAKAGVGELAYFNNIDREIAQLQTVK